MSIHCVHPLTESYSGRIPYSLTLLSLRTPRSSLLIFVFTLNIGLELSFIFIYPFPTSPISLQQ
ncbi:hypothetical protein BDQ94DRAFT_140136 [Aspergillus welwitschiae]|uniref:Uncharacterized protein n=1 Tax=Aspergillus welwitschiae TaxID=1341132 RepID=A0A3F3Q7E5_9EURO|nr:hypothetical protein BDQ94DRAFT_140136 [Aspergillus welwitschiae]RDH35035.1 hypothetical protein BDQ94DRAFT_140136 [Aspergillus welwitschiae]